MFNWYRTLIAAWHGYLPDTSSDMRLRSGCKEFSTVTAKPTGAAAGAVARWELSHPSSRWSLMGVWREPESNFIERWFEDVV